jgi:hypothetical protein
MLARRCSCGGALNEPLPSLKVAEWLKECGDMGPAARHQHEMQQHKVRAVRFQGSRVAEGVGTRGQRACRGGSSMKMLSAPVRGCRGSERREPQGPQTKPFTQRQQVSSQETHNLHWRLQAAWLTPAASSRLPNHRACRVHTAASVSMLRLDAHLRPCPWAGCACRGLVAWSCACSAACCCVSAHQPPAAPCKKQA